MLRSQAVAHARAAASRRTGMMLLRSALAAFSLVAAAPAFAGQAADARLYGHLPYPDADPAMLVAAPEGFDLRQPCLLRREVLPDLTALIAAAQDRKSTRLNSSH